MSICLCTLQPQDADLVETHLNSLGRASSAFSGLWIRAVNRVVFEPKLLFACSKFSVILTLEKNISRSKVYPPGCTQKKQGRSSA